MIEFYGAGWCGDCKRAKDVLNSRGVPFDYHDIDNEEGAAQTAIDISGQKHIPVLRFSDESFLVEPSAIELTNKLRELGIIAE
jgi:glutaredoxin-like protein